MLPNTVPPTPETKLSMSATLAPNEEQVKLRIWPSRTAADTGMNGGDT